MGMDPYSDRQLFGRKLKLEGARTAVIVIDMLNDFCTNEGLLGNPAALSLCENQNRVMDKVRASGGLVIFVNEQHREMLKPQREFGKRMTHTIEGTWGAEVVSDLTIDDADLAVVKRRYSGFFQTDLDLILRDRLITSVVLMGVLANICVRATAHDAFFQGYDVVVPEDCVGSMTPSEQNSTLYDIGTHFGWVTDSAAVVNALDSGQPLTNTVVLGVHK